MKKMIKAIIFGSVNKEMALLTSEIERMCNVKI